MYTVFKEPAEISSASMSSDFGNFNIFNVLFFAKIGLIARLFTISKKIINYNELLLLRKFAKIIMYFLGKKIQ